MIRRSEKTAPSLLQVNLSPNLVVYSCIVDENQLTVTFVKKSDRRGQNVMRKQQIVFTGAETEAFLKYILFLEYFQLYHVFGRENAKVETNPFTYPKSAVPVLMSQTDKSLLAEIR